MLSFEFIVGALGAFSAAHLGLMTGIFFRLGGLNARVTAQGVRIGYLETLAGVK